MRRRLDAKENLENSRLMEREGMPNSAFRLGPPRLHPPASSVASSSRWDEDEDAEEDKLCTSLPPPSVAWSAQSTGWYSAASAEQGTSVVPPGPQPASLSGEEAYQRRLAMTQQAQTGEDAYLRRIAMSKGLETTTQAQQPYSSHQSSLPSSVGQPATSTSAESSGITSHPDLAARQSAAAAIAARLARSVPEATQAPSESSGLEPARTLGSAAADPTQFAAQLMAKWGHQEGEGLGTDGNRGRTEALMMEKTRGGDKPRMSCDEWGQITSHFQGPRGRFTSQDPRAVQDLARFGTPSEIVLLENVITSADEVDDALPQEISAECSRHGIVKRVAIQPPSRVFVVFTGPAGAWKCVRELDGRFFAGRTVRARYYERPCFERGDYWN